MAISTLVNLIEGQILGHTFQPLATVLLTLPLICLIANEFCRYSARIRALPGPKGLPLIGNLWSIRRNAAEQYRSWARKYGGVYQIQLGNIPVVVVNTAAAAKVLFGQHAQALSSRPEFYTFHKVGYAHELLFSILDENLGGNNFGRCFRIRREQRLVLHRTVIL